MNEDIHGYSKSVKGASYHLLVAICGAASLKLDSQVEHE